MWQGKEYGLGLFYDAIDRVSKQTTITDTKSGESAATLRRP
jgi:hypothetical protein